MLKSRNALTIRQLLLNLILSLSEKGLDHSCLTYHFTDWQPK
jgi:hypothetical protein